MIIFSPELKLDPKMYEKEKKEIEKAKQRDRALTVFAGTSRALLVIDKFEKGIILVFI